VNGYLSSQLKDSSGNWHPAMEDELDKSLQIERRVKGSGGKNGGSIGSIIRHGGLVDSHIVLFSIFLGGVYKKVWNKGRFLDLGPHLKGFGMGVKKKVGEN